MIVARAPLRISFVGGGTDLPDFYRREPGRVISAAIDKYVFIVLNRTPLVNKVSIRYSRTETVDDPVQLDHTRVRAALLDLGITRNLEIGSFASLPARTGLGSSSTFSVALLSALHAYLGRSLETEHLAQAACRLEIDLVGERIGKQDQYAAAFGGLHVFQFNPDESVDARRVVLSIPERRKFEFHILVFYTGLTRDAGTVLKDQASHVVDRLEVMRRMAADVETFERHLISGDIRALGELLDENWQRKRTLSGLISNGLIDTLYNEGRAAGAWGGKLLGAGGGGCLLFLAPPDRHDALRSSMFRLAAENNLPDFVEVPISLGATGGEVLFRGGLEE